MSEGDFFSGLDAMLGDGREAKSNGAGVVDKEREGGRLREGPEGFDRSAPAPACAPVREDPITAMVNAWDLTELVMEIDQTSEERLKQFFCRKRIAEIIKLGITAMRPVTNKKGETYEIPDTATRAFYNNFLVRHFLGKQERTGPRKVKGDESAPAASLEDLFTSLADKPDMRALVIARLQAMDADEAARK